MPGAGESTGRCKQLRAGETQDATMRQRQQDAATGGMQTRAAQEQNNVSRDPNCVAVLGVKGSFGSVDVGRSKRQRGWEKGVKLPAMRYDAGFSCGISPKVFLINSCISGNSGY